MTRALPKIVALAGPNGAGKSTVGPTLIRDMLGVTEFVNADVIARGISAFDSDKVALAAGRIMLGRMRELADKRASFSFETTLAGRSFAPWIEGLAPCSECVNGSERVDTGFRNRSFADAMRRAWRTSLNCTHPLRRGGPSTIIQAQASDGSPQDPSERPSKCSTKGPGVPSHNGSFGDPKLRRKLAEHARRVERGLRKAVLQAALEHKRLGLPMVICEGGKVREVSAETIIRANRRPPKRRR